MGPDMAKPSRLHPVVEASPDRLELRQCFIGGAPCAATRESSRCLRKHANAQIYCSLPIRREGLRETANDVAVLGLGESLQSFGGDIAECPNRQREFGASFVIGKL